MKYVKQFAVIAAVSFVGELLNKILPFPVPASVYGLVLMVLLLLTKVVKLEMIEDVSEWVCNVC